MTEERPVLSPEFEDQRPVLRAGLTGIGLALEPARQQQLLGYLELMRRWNRAYNLTAIVDPGEMVARHLLDSLVLLPHLPTGRLLDAGTGAGLPGVPLAIACPERQMVLLDGNGKKIRFLGQVRRELGLDNIEPVQGRLETFRPEPAPDAIVARALAPLERLVRWTACWLDRGIPLLAMKGDLSESERLAVPAPYNVSLMDLDVPGLSARRCLVRVEKP